MCEFDKWIVDYKKEKEKEKENEKDDILLYAPLDKSDLISYDATKDYNNGDVVMLPESSGFAPRGFYRMIDGDFIRMGLSE